MAKKPKPLPSSPKLVNSPFAGLAGLREQLVAEHGEPDPPAAASPTPDASESVVSRVVLRREKKGRGGKTVTRVSGLERSGDELTALAKDLKRALGCGATVDGDDILLQGAQTDRAKAHFERLGVKRVVVGN